MTDWQTRASCAGIATFHDDIPRAATLCASCPVRSECEQTAKDDPHFEGIAGGFEWYGERHNRRTKHRLWPDAEMKLAHGAYVHGRRDKWAVDGERAYRRALGRAA